MSDKNKTMRKCIYPAHINENKVQTCDEHCRRTAEYSRNDLQAINLGNSAYLAGILHDCGKFTEEFQKYIVAANSGENVKKGTVIHSFAGVYYLLTHYHSNVMDPYVPLTAELVAYAIGAHHGLFDCVDEDHENRFAYRLAKQPEYEQRAIANFVDTCCDEEELSRLFQSSVKEIESVVGSIGNLSESNDEIFFYLGLLSRLLSASVMDGDRRDTAEFMGHENFDKCIKATPELWKTARENLEKLLNSYPQETRIQKARKEISDICFTFADEPTGVYRLNVPTGGGKTLSSLRYALAHAEKYGKKRIIYTAPFISILDQNADVIRKAIQNDQIVLEHHSNIIYEESNAEKAQPSNYELLVETWDAPIIITTLVQLLNTFFSSKTSCVRRFQSLCNSIIIIDEVQSVPTNMLSLFNLTLNFLCNICDTTIILCSATQPCLDDLSKHKLNISPKNMISEEAYRKYYRTFKRTELINKGNYKLDSLPILIDEVLEERDSLLVVCNTKSEAGRIYKAVKDKYENCFHLSAAMCMAHRKEVLDRLNVSLAAGEKTICVATQVIEAGVDISFDAVIRLTAGIDNIVQAAGRCNRNGEKQGNSPVYIVRCDDEKLGSLSEIISAQNATNNLLACYAETPENFDGDIASDKSVRFYYDSLYNSLPSDYRDFPLKNLPSIFSMLSDNQRFAEGSKDVENYSMRQAYKLAGDKFEVFDKDAATVIVPYKEGDEIITALCTARAEHDIAYLNGLLQKAKNYSVSVYRDQLQKLQQTGAITAICNSEIFVLSDDWYEKDTGLQNEPAREEDEWNTLIL